MLENVNIQNFRLFENFSIQNLAKVNLIVGKNNVGKSSLLEALYLLASQSSPEILLSLLDARGEISYDREASRLRNYDISHLFFGHRLENGASILIQAEDSTSLGLKITFVKDFEQLSLFASEKELKERRPDPFLRFEYLGTQRKFDLGLEDDTWLNRRRLLRYSDSISRKFNSTYVTTKGFDYDQLADLWDSITLTPQEDDVIKMLQILEPDVERLSFQSRKTSNSGILIKRKGQTKPLPLGIMGEGMHRVLTIAIALANSENGYLFIDEIDTGLHYRTITDMWNLVFKTAERLNIQVFATTHSSDCITSFDEALDIQENQDTGRLFRLEDRANQIVTVPYNRKDLAIATQQEIEVR